MGMKRRRKDMGKQQMKLQDFQNALFTIPHVYEQLSNKNWDTVKKKKSTDIVYLTKYKKVMKKLGLNMFLIPINISTFRFSPSKIFLQLLVPIKFSITTFDPYF